VPLISDFTSASIILFTVVFYQGYQKTMTCEHLNNLTVENLISKAAYPIFRCEECIKINSRWVHLRICQTCGKMLFAIVSLIDGTTELAIGAHFANNIAYFLLFNWSGSFFATPALFSISEYHARFYDITSLVLIPVFLVIVFRVFKRDQALEPVSWSDRKGRW
jgi:hypothetical protein